MWRGGHGSCFFFSFSMDENKPCFFPGQAHLASAVTRAPLRVNGGGLSLFPSSLVDDERRNLILANAAASSLFPNIVFFLLRVLSLPGVRGR